MSEYIGNTIESLRNACSVKDWNGYDADPIPEEVFQKAEAIEKYLPLDETWDLFPGGDGSLQYENRYDDDMFYVEIYPDGYYVEELDTHADISFNYPETVKILFDMYKKRKAKRKNRDLMNALTNFAAKLYKTQKPLDPDAAAVLEEAVQAEFDANNK